MHKLTPRICRRLNLCSPDNAEAITATLREALIGRSETAVAATKAACLTIAEEEAERCRRVGASTAEVVAPCWVLPGAKWPRVNGWRTLARDSAETVVDSKPTS